MEFLGFLCECSVLEESQHVSVQERANFRT
jgi:hypothetical protein